LSDATRATSPLAKAGDATSIDTTALTIDQVVERVMDVVEDRRKAKGERQKAK
jgi:cytidylate kinase